MSIKVDVSGLEDFAKKLEKAADSISGEYSLGELLTDSFMSKHTNFPDASTWLEAGGFSFESSEEFEAISDNDLNSYVAKSTPFSDWDSLLSAAGEKLLTEKLEF